MMSSIPFNTARGAASTLQMSPPFSFSDVTMSVFPLRAGLPRLDAFCQNYLNQAPHIVQFKPFIPFVYLVILDYGRMSLEAANMGWVSQREVAFGIPLRWLNTRSGGSEFHDWAFTSPFIFVDNEISMSTGREVYGWPKLLARLDPSVSEWVHDPHGSREVFQVSTKRAAQAYAGEKRDYHTFLSVVQHRTAGMFDIPPSMDAIVKPVAQLSTAAAGMSRLSVDLLRTFSGMASDGITGTSVLPEISDLEVFREQLKPARMKDWVDARKWMPGMRDTLWSLFPRFYANTVNFKQFRDARDPVAACYQAVTAARMPVTAVKRGGMLGPQNMLMGQLDGGYRVDVHQLAGLPIVDSLGLEVTEERIINETTVSSLTPVCPFWLEVDMTYGLADTIVWRGRHGQWRRGTETNSQSVAEENPEFEPKAAEVSADRSRDPIEVGSGSEDSSFGTASAYTSILDENSYASNEDKGEAEPEREASGLDYLRAINFFNTARGATEALGGGFSMPNSSLRVLPLKADPALLSVFVRDYLRIEGKMRFEAWGDYVYMIIADFESMTSDVNAVSTTTAREINLAIPVKCYSWFEDEEYAFEHGHPHEHEWRQKGQDWKEQRFLRGAKHLVTTGYVVPFSFVDDTGSAITASEVRGIPTMSAAITSPANDWLQLDHSRSQVHRSLLETTAQVLPALMAGAESQKRTLIELHTHTPPKPEAHQSAHLASTRWAGVLADDLDQKREESLYNNPSLPHDTPDYIKQAFSRSENTADTIGLGRGFALKLLAGELPFNQFSMKQFRDAKQTGDACYQGLVMNRHTVGNLRDLREIDGLLHVSITDFPTQPICEILGLIPKFSYPGQDRIVRVFEALRPFSMQADIYRHAGLTLYERAGEEDWEAVDFPEQIFGRKPVSDMAVVDRIIAQAPIFDSMDATEISYHWNEPGNRTDRTFRCSPVTSNFLTSTFSRHATTGTISDLVLSERYRFGSVSVLTNTERLDEIEKGKHPDLSTYNHQMIENGHENQYAIAELAAATEFISPATITDIVLSEQWGLANGSERQKFGKSWFCYRTESVENPLGNALFPPTESLRRTWPMTYRFHEAQIRRRSSQILGFISEFWAVVDFLSAMIDIEHGSFPNKSQKSRKAIKGDKPATSPKLKFHETVKQKIPRVFWKDRMQVDILDGSNLSPYQARSSADWAELRQGIVSVFEHADELLSIDFNDDINELRDRWVELADKSRVEMSIIETQCEKYNEGSNLEFFYLQFQQEILRERLSKLGSTS